MRTELKEKIIEASIEKYDFKKALEEYDVVGYYVKNKMTCHCGEPNIKYCFVIRNRNTGIEFDPIGSVCIEYFKKHYNEQHLSKQVKIWKRGDMKIEYGEYQGLTFKEVSKKNPFYIPDEKLMLKSNMRKYNNYRILTTKEYRNRVDELIEKIKRPLLSLIRNRRYKRCNNFCNCLKIVMRKEELCFECKKKQTRETIIKNNLPKCRKCFVMIKEDRKLCLECFKRYSKWQKVGSRWYIKTQKYHKSGTIVRVINNNGETSNKKLTIMIKEWDQYSNIWDYQN